MQSFDFKRFLPTLFTIIGFAVFALIYSFPQMEGKVLQQSDNVQWKAMSKEGIDWHEETGEDVLWSNSMFGGMPTYTYYVPTAKNYVFYIQKAIVDGVVRKPACFLFIAMVGFFILLRVLKINHWLSVLGAFAYAFSTYNIDLLAAGHETKMLAIGYMPAVMAGLLLLYSGNWLGGVPLLAFSSSLLISSGHYQIVYYALILIFAMAVGHLVIAVREKNVKHFIFASIAALVIGVVSIGPTLQNILVTMEYNKETMRGGHSELTINHDENKTGGGLDKEYAFRWSNSIPETFVLLVPGLFGGSSSEPLSTSSATYEKVTSMGVPEESAEQMIKSLPVYWGPQPFIGAPVYFGAIICFLFVLGMMIIKSVHKWWIAAGVIISIVMSWGNHFAGLNYFLFDTLPMLNKFRVPSMILVIAELLFPLTAIWALNDIIQEKVKGEELWKHIKTATIITAGLCLVLAFGSSAFFDFRAPATNNMNDNAIAAQFGQAFGNEQAGQEVLKAIREDRASMATNSGIVSAVYILLAAAALWAFYKKKINGTVLIAGMSLLIFVDLMSVARKYLNEENFMEETDYESMFQPRPVDQQIMQDPDPYYRVFDLSRNPYNDALQAYFHKCVGGYSPAKMERYQDMIDVHLGQSLNAQVLNMLNTKYIISPNGPNGQPVAIPNPEALGNAWFVNEVKWAKTADEEMLSLNANRLGDTAQVANAFEPAKTAVIRSTYQNELNGYTFGKDSSAKVRLDKYGLNNISFASNNSQNGLAVFSDIYYPHGWTAYIDGKETPILKANYILRALKIPAGQHKIEFKFHPKSFYLGNTVAIITSILIYLVGFACLFLAYKRAKHTKPLNG